MNNVIQKLKEYSKQVDLKKRFEYSINASDSFFTLEETENINSFKNAFQQNVNLKWLINEKYK